MIGLKNLLQQMGQTPVISNLVQLHRNFQARAARNFRANEIIKVLSAMHIEELAHTPGEQWALVKKQQALEIRAVMDGKFDIVDRRTWGYPWMPESLHRLKQPIIKNTPYNIRRFSETPIPRRAINLIKNAILSKQWRIQPTQDYIDDKDPNREKRIRIATESLKRPNNVDSFRTLLEAVIEDICIVGAGVIEPQITPFVKRPFKLWSVDPTTIRMFMNWSESEPDQPKYAQMTGFRGQQQIIAFRADELIYMRDNVRTNTPFGLGKLEIAFASVNALLGAQDAAGKAGADTTHRTWLWFEQPQSEAQLQGLRQYIQNEIEGQAKIGLMSGMKKPEIIDVQATTSQDLLIDWQEFLIKIVGLAFDLSPFSMGLEEVGKNIGQTMADADFHNAVVPMARRIEEHFTRDLIHGILGWKDLEFKFMNLEDPDMNTLATIEQRLFGMNALTVDEIREAHGKPPLAGNWGKINMLQGTLLQLVAQAVVQQKAAEQQPGAGGEEAGSPTQPGAQSPSNPFAPQGGGGKKSPSAGGSFNKPVKVQMPKVGTPSLGMPGMPGMPKAGGFGSGSKPGAQVPPAKPIGAAAMLPPGPMPSSKFSAAEVAGMDVATLMEHQKNGMVAPTPTLTNEMEQQAPGILQKLTQELQQFFNMVSTNDEDVDPEEVTQADAYEQVTKFERSKHKMSDVERAMNYKSLEAPARNAGRGKVTRPVDRVMKKTRPE